MLSFLPRIAFSAVGIALLAIVVAHVGRGALVEGVAAVVGWLPLVAAFEAARMSCEVVATSSLLKQARQRPPLGTMLRAQLSGYATNLVIPGGRPACEAVRASVLARYIGSAHAAAIGVMNQALNLIGEAVISVITFGALLVIGGNATLSCAVLAHAAICSAAGALVLRALRGGALPKFIGRFARIERWLGDVRAAGRELPSSPRLGLAAFVISKLLATASLAVLLHGGGVALGGGRLIVVQALSSVASAVSDMSPAQLGSIDAIFAIGADKLAADLRGVASATAGLHVVQLGWVAFAGCVALLRFVVLRSTAPGASEVVAQ